jgi:RNA polymerase sigma factor (TIGR02999 family)
VRLPATRAEATELLARGLEQPRAADRLLPLVYTELRALAARYLRSERAGSTLQPTALVHEAYLRLIGNERIDWKGKTHFKAMAATQMRRILVDHARARGAKKRGGGRPITLTETLLSTATPSPDLLALDQALGRLAARSPRQGRVAELKLFAGLPSTEIAFSLGVSERTVKEDWRVARAWLMKEIAGAGGPS